MKVFISWSGSRSHAVAELVASWIKCVLQATQPWVSSRDIDRGALWFSEIGDQLKDTTVGIVCLTAENKDKPWILFEAGALAKGLSSSRVCTLLIDLKSSDLEDPLAQFNHTFPTKDSISSLVRTLNSALPAGQLDAKTLDEVFATYWPKFEAQFEAALKAYPAGVKSEPRSDTNLLAEILENTRTLQHRMSRLEDWNRADTLRTVSTVSTATPFTGSTITINPSLTTASTNPFLTGSTISTANTSSIGSTGNTTGFFTVPSNLARCPQCGLAPSRISYSGVKPTATCANGHSWS